MNLWPKSSIRRLSTVTSSLGSAHMVVESGDMPHHISWQVVSRSYSLLDTAAAMSKSRQFQPATSEAKGDDRKEQV